jgi:hypothetical protein
MTTPGAYNDGLPVSWPTGGVAAPTLDKVFATVDSTTGLLFGGMLETTTRYVQLIPPYGSAFDEKGEKLRAPYSPKFAEYKGILACTTAGVMIQKREILTGYTWTPSALGGYVGFLYRGKNAPQEPLKNVLGSGTLEITTLRGRVTERVEPFRINVTEQF